MHIALDIWFDIFNATVSPLAYCLDGLSTMGSSCLGLVRDPPSLLSNLQP